MGLKNAVGPAFSALAIAGLACIAAQAPAQADQSSSVTFEVFGSGSVYTIDTDPAGPRVYDAPLPWSTTITVGPEVDLLQVVAVGKDSPGPGCRITLDGVVVAEEPTGGSAHCIFTRS